MTSLSWFIYFASLVDSISTVFGLAAIILVVLFGFTFILNFMMNDDVHHSDKETLQKNYEYVKSIRRPLYWLVPIFIFISIVVPSRDTLILIAASEIGQKVVFSEQVQNALSPSGELIQTWIKNETQKIQSEIIRRNAPSQSR
jgi:sensor domain CHASE-containing protein